MTTTYLRQWRLERCLTQREAAALLDVSRRQWCAWEHGEAPIRRVVELALMAVDMEFFAVAGIWPPKLRQAFVSQPYRGGSSSVA